MILALGEMLKPFILMMLELGELSMVITLELKHFQ
jgi:hypothetical protein